MALNASALCVLAACEEIPAIEPNIQGADAATSRSARACDNDADCDNEHCVSGNCCSSRCEEPGDTCQVAAGATCEDGERCVYPPLPNDTACDDRNACTQDDRCLAGWCVPGPATPCSDGNSCTMDSCDPRTGCTFDARDGEVCVGEDKSCHTAFVCEGTTCVGAGNACGSPVASTGCTPGEPNEPNTCACTEAYRDLGEGRCVPDDDECAGDEDPCTDDPNSECVDPDNGPDNAICVCGDGYLDVGGRCQCDLTGTFALELKTVVRWNEHTRVSATIEGTGAGGAQDRIWELWTIQHDAEGELAIERRSCGRHSGDSCDITNRKASRVSMPINAWDLPTMPTAKLQIQQPSALPGDTLSTGMSAFVFGVTLEEPLDPDGWPATRQMVPEWPDHDGDGHPGITHYYLGSGASEECPRLPSSPQGPYPYAYPIRGATAFYVGVRTLGGYSGTLESCDRLTGTATGPMRGYHQEQARVQGCALDVCALNSAVDIPDGFEEPREIVSGEFELNRVADRNEDGVINCIDSRDFYGN